MCSGDLTSVYPELSCPSIRTELSAHPDFFMSAGTQELLARLPITQRHILAWKADGFSTAEIALLTEKTEATVRKNLQRARDTLKARLAERQGGAQ